MPTDCRNLPEPLLKRLMDAGADLSTRTAGFDVNRGSRILEQRVIKRDDASLMLERRQTDDGTDQPVIRGYASVWGFEYDLYGGPDMGGWTESVEAGAATKSIDENDNVRMLFDHAGLPLGATRAGTLSLEDDSIGLLNETMPDTRSQYSMEIVNRIDRGELDAMSFAFQVTRQEWNENFTRRFIREVRLFDVSVVNYPANPATVVGLGAGYKKGKDKKRGMGLSLATASIDSLTV